MAQERRWIHKFQLKKGRWVYHPTEETKESGRKIKESIYKNTTFPAFYWHLNKGGHVGAIKCHVRNRYFFSVDISDFFGSINKSRITRVLKPIFGYKESRRIAVQSTVLHPEEKKYILPYGFSQSPILASLVLRDSALGKYLNYLFKDKRLVVSVYVDDIMVSGCNLKLLEKAFVKVKHFSDKSNFLISEKKTSPPGKLANAFNIEVSNGLTKIQYDRLQELKRDAKYARSENQFEGILNYVYSVNNDQGNMIQNLR